MFGMVAAINSGWVATLATAYAWMVRNLWIAYTLLFG